MAVRLGAEVIGRYQRFSLYNSPYPAHDEGCAIDLYPGTLRDGRTTVAPSPVSGVVRETRTVRAPTKPYAPDHDHLIVLECDGPGDLEGLVARVLHVEPAVTPGQRVEAGERLGTLVRAGFFAPWVDNHLHVGFREHGANPYRASGSLPIELALEVRPLEWDGTGRVVETGESSVVLDSPAHPNPGKGFAGVRADDGGVLDGGIPHYDGGGLLSGPDGQVSLNGDRLGVTHGRTTAWDDVVVLANDEPVTGLSLFSARDGGFGAKLVCPDREFPPGDRLEVAIRPAADVAR